MYIYTKNTAESRLAEENQFNSNASNKGHFNFDIETHITNRNLHKWVKPRADSQLANYCAENGIFIVLAARRLARTLASAAATRRQISNGTNALNRTLIVREKILQSRNLIRDVQKHRHSS
jgi:S-adenosylhomocysteine hydrolase